MDNAHGDAIAAAIINAAHKSGRTLLTVVESKQFLDACGIPTVPARVAQTEEEAVRLAAEFGPIVVLKLYSETITHKTDWSGSVLTITIGRSQSSASRKAPETKEDEIIAVGRLIKLHDANDAEFAIVISDQWQGHGLGTHFMRLLLDIGRKEGVEHIFGHMLAENNGMQPVLAQR
jgi:N-acetylglutamate synthase-like GNAT family acetyltransferase